VRSPRTATFPRPRLLYYGDYSTADGDADAAASYYKSAADRESALGAFKYATVLYFARAADRESALGTHCPHGRSPRAALERAAADGAGAAMAEHGRGGPADLAGA
jgi:hypothetical protein